jgi:hypothetical protein
VPEVMTMITVQELRSLLNECTNISIIDYSKIDEMHEWMAILDLQIVKNRHGHREF